MKDKTCCFTGHRDVPLSDYIILKFKLRREISRLIKRGVIYFGCGGARGFDLMAAKTVLKLKKRYPQIYLILVLPCAKHTLNWYDSDLSKYEYIAKHADKIKLLSYNYYNGCMHARNRHLVDNSSFCVCYKRHDYGGTAYTFDYAKSQNIEIISL